MTTAKKYLLLGFVLAFALTAGQQQVLRAGSDAKEFAFETVDVPGGTTQPQGINDAGDISGILTDATGIRHGFVLRHRERVATIVDFPGAAWTRLWGINPQGDVVGTYETFIPFDVPDSTLIWAYDINPQARTNVSEPPAEWGGSPSLGCARNCVAA